MDNGPWTDREQHLVDLAEAESANSAQMANALLGQPLEDDADVEGTTLTDELSSVSPDLDDRWRGALFSLNPRNPDAARHFCTGSREVVIQMIDLNAPDAQVLAAVPGCETKVDGKPSRRAKIRYLLERAGSTRRDSLEEFVDADIDDVLNLFRVFNSGTHGSAGTMDIPTRQGLKTRVEGAVRFLPP